MIQVRIPQDDDMCLYLLKKNPKVLKGKNAGIGLFRKNIELFSALISPSSTSCSFSLTKAVLFSD